MLLEKLVMLKQRQKHSEVSVAATKTEKYKN